MNNPYQSLPRLARHRQEGFSLIEVLIALVIAMVGVVIMMEVLSFSEERTRTTTSGNEALSNGAVMTHLIQRDLVQAGYGFNSVKLLGCNLVLPNPAATVVPIAPVTINPAPAIIPAGDANTHTLLVMYGNSNGQPEGNDVFGVDGSTYSLQAPASFAVQDKVIAYPGSCAANLTLAEVTEVTALDATVNTAQAGAKTVYNLGRAPRVVGYAIRGGSLSTCDLMAADCTSMSNWTAVGANIVGLRAQYGRDLTGPPMDGSVDTWDTTTPTTACEWARTPAVRFALVARSTKYETAIDTTTQQRVCSQVTTAAPPWTAASATIDVSGVGADWQCYRYRTFETIAPSRNIVWMGAQC